MRPSPSRSQNSTNDRSRRPVRPRSKTSRRASFLAVHAASRSIRSTSLSALAVAARVDDPAVRRVLEPAQLGNVLDPQVEGVHEAPRGRQVRRGLHRRDRLGGVQGVDQHEVGVVRGRGPGRQVGKVAQVAHAPRLGRAHLVQLCHQAHDPTLGHGGRQREALRSHDEGGLHGAGVDRGHVEAGHEAVPAHGQVTGHLEGRLTQRAAVDLAVGHPSVDLRYLAHGAVLEHDVEPDAGARRHVGVDPRRPPLTGDDGGGQRPAPGGELDVDERLLDRVVALGLDAQRREHGPDGRRRDGDVLALPVPVLRRDPVGVGELDEPGRRGGGDHAPHPAVRGRVPRNRDGAAASDLVAPRVLRVEPEHPACLVDRQQRVVLAEVSASLDAGELLGDELGVRSAHHGVG